jgi:hypothetical protein
VESSIDYRRIENEMTFEDRASRWWGDCTSVQRWIRILPAGEIDPSILDIHLKSGSNGP